MHTVRIRDVQRKNPHHWCDLSGDTEVLLVPNDLWECQGPCVLENGLVTYKHKSGVHQARVRADILDNTKPGDRLLIQYDEAHRKGNEWWLCEVVAVDGDNAG